MNTNPGIPFRAMNLREAEVEVRGAGNAIYLRHPEALRTQDADLLALLERCCGQYAHRTFLAERESSGWRSMTFAAFFDRVERMAAVLEIHGIGRREPVGLLASNGIDNAVVHFALLAIGAIVVPLSPAYLAHPQGAAILGSLASKAAARRVVHDDPPRVNEISIDERLSLTDLVRQAAGDIRVSPLASRRPTIKPEDDAKIYFTSGSTGSPKAVRLTHRMLVSAASALEQISPRMPDDQIAVTVDWLPWAHTFGGNVNIHAALMRGKTLYIDSGAPLPGRFDVTIEHLNEVCPTEFGSVPAAYPMLLQALEQREEFARRFFSRVRTCSYGGAALSPSLVERFQDLAIRTCGERILFGGGYGMTEACGLLTMVYWQAERADLLGLPVPGVEMKLVGIESGRWECRVRGPNVFEGYDEATEESLFDDEGYFMTGDSVEFASSKDPAQGLVFAGRIREDFKLSNGTWVRTGCLREALLDKLRPWASDLVIVGENRDEVAALVWSPQTGLTSHGELLRLCREFNLDRHGVTQRIARLAIVDRAPDAAAGEVTPKGTINLRKLLGNRSSLVDAIYSTESCRVAAG